MDKKIKKKKYTGTLDIDAFLYIFGIFAYNEKTDEYVIGAALNTAVGEGVTIKGVEKNHKKVLIETYLPDDGWLYHGAEIIVLTKKNVPYLLEDMHSPHCVVAQAMVDENDNTIINVGFAKGTDWDEGKRNFDYASPERKRICKYSIEVNHYRSAYFVEPLTDEEHGMLKALMNS